MNRLPIMLLPQPPIGLLPPPEALLREAIPERGDEAYFLARQFFLHHDSIMRWRRPAPTAAERRVLGPRGSGAASPLHRNCDLIRYVGSYDLKAAGKIAVYPYLYYQALVEESAAGFDDDRACAEANALLLKEATDAVNHMQLVGVCSQTLSEQIELRDMASLMIASTYATMLRREAA